MRPAIHRLMVELYECAAWSGDPSHPVIDQIRAELEEADAGSSDEGESFLLNGLDVYDAIESLYQLACVHGGKSPVVVAGLETLDQYSLRVRSIGESAAAQGEGTFASRTWERERLDDGQPLSTLRTGGIEHRIGFLAARNKWTLLIASKSSVHEHHGSPPESIQRRLSKVKMPRAAVGLLVPADLDRALLRLKSEAEHSSNPERLDVLLQRLLEMDVGVLGVRAFGTPIELVNQVVAWVLRLIPVADQLALSIALVEPATPERVSGLGLLGGEVLRRLALSNPNRYSRITVSGTGTRGVADEEGAETGVLDEGEGAWPDCDGIVRDKEGTSDWRDEGLLAAAVLQTWCGGSASDEARLEQSGLLGTCLYGEDSESLLAAWDTAMAGRSIDARCWFEIVRGEDACREGSLAAEILGRAADHVRCNVDVWKSYHNTLVQELDSKAVHLEAIEPAVEWLQSNLPPDADGVEPRLQLAWLTTRLAAGNLVGRADAGCAEQMAKLADRLYEEDAPLVCLAELHLSVRETNRFAFDAATRALTRWSRVPVEVPGRQMWARVQSSLGQHAAFRGDFRESQRYLDTALEAFGRLSDERVGRLEWLQTATYRAIVAMDDPEVPSAEARERVSAIVELAPRKIAAMAGSADRSAQYIHHTLVRYLVYRGSEEETRAYLSARWRWKSREGHPWELIQAYRAILLWRSGDPTGARDLVTDAWSMCFRRGTGPTLRMIGTALAAIRRRWGIEWSDAQATLSWLEGVLPDARNRIGVLRREFSDRPLEGDPSGLLAEVLPFNFH